MTRTLAALALLFLSVAALQADATKASTMHYMRALVLENQGKVADALKEYEAAIALDPQSTFLVEQGVQAAIEGGKPELALAMAQKLTQLDPKSAKAQYLLGNVQWARGDVAAAQSAFERALKLNPAFSDAMLSLGNLLSSQSPAKARKYFEDYLAANPEHAAEAQYQLGLLDQKEGNLDSAVKHLQAAVDANPESLQARFTLAQAYEADKDTAAALGQYQLILERDPENVALRNHIGEIYFMRGDLAAAEEQFQRAKKSAPDNPSTCLWLAILAEQRGDFNQAATELSKSSALKEEGALNLRLSYYLTQANRIPEAVKVLEEAHKRWPDNEDVSYFLALGYDDLKQSDKAIALLAGLLKAHPDFRDARFQLGALYEKENRMDDAEREFRALIDQRPNDASSLNYLGYSLTDRGLKLAEAEQMIRRAVELDPSNGAYRDSLGWSAYKQGRYADARAELEKSAKLLPADPTVWEHLGDARAALNDDASAWEAYVRSEAVERSDRVRKKREALESKVPADELGRRSLEVAASRLRGLSSFGGPCEVSGEVGRKEFRFAGLLKFSAPEELDLDLLGPLFVPMFRIRLKGENGFEMDPVRLEGVSPDAVQDAVYRGLSLVRDYLGGKLFDSRPATFKRGWRTDSVRTPEGDFTFRDGRTLSVFQSAAQPSVKLSVDYSDAQPRALPVALKLQGRGFELDVQLSRPTARFEGAAP